MRILSTEFGQVTWIVDFVFPSGFIYLPDALHKLTQRYGFVKPPSVEQLLSDQPKYIFQHGKYRDFVIRNFSIHSDGFVAESQGGTHLADAFLDDFMGWATEEFNATTLDINEQYKVFDSHLIVQLDVDLSSKMKFVSFISDAINKHMETYGRRASTYFPAGFYLAPDNARANVISTSTFRIERRQGQEFSKNVFFSTAPLRTEDHKKLLEEIEEVI